MADKRRAQDYLNAPIEIYKRFIIDSKEVLLNVAAYACYEFKTARGYEFADAVKYFELTFTNPKEAEIKGQRLYENLPRNTAIVGISKTVLMDYLNNDKTELQKATLLGFLAIKSIIGKKKYCKTNNLMMLSRMDGNNNCTNKLSPEIAKYKKPYWGTKIRQQLQLYWGLQTKQGKGIYCSFTLTYKALLNEIYKKSEAYNLKKLQQDNKNIKEDFLQERYAKQRDKINIRDPLNYIPFL